MRISLKDVTMEFSITGGKKVAVNHVSLEINFGERVGIIGRNGSGKTTLLQIISGLSKPSSGRVEVEGRVNCIMTLGIGLREELSGRDNIYVDGEIKGRSYKEVDQVIEDIIGFADIGEFIDYPVRTYSTGMKSRLAFALNILLEPGILVIDEVLSVGDAQFSAKATKKMKEICAKGKILVLVSHSMESIINMCDRCIWMDEGRIVMDGSSAIVTEAYLQKVRETEEKMMQHRFKKRIGGTLIDSSFAIEDIEFLDRNDHAKRIFCVGEEMKVLLMLKSDTHLERPDIKITFERLDGNILAINSAFDDGFELSPIQGKAVFEILIGQISFGEDTYEVHVELIDRDRTPESNILAEYCDVLKIEKTKPTLDNPAYFSPVEWTFESVETGRNS